MYYSLYNFINVKLLVMNMNVCGSVILWVAVQCVFVFSCLCVCSPIFTYYLQLCILFQKEGWETQKGRLDTREREGGGGVGE